MLLIFGVRRRGYRMVNVFALCGVCHAPAAQAVARIRTFFTFFFIPLIPLGSKYRSTCTLCGATISLTKEQAEAAVESARHGRAEAHTGTAPSAPAAAFGPSPAAPSPASAFEPDSEPGGGPPSYPN
jgi:hypothetical protein